MKLEFNLDWEIAAQVAGYAWALDQVHMTELDDEACYRAHYARFVAGTELEEDPPEEANRAMSAEAWMRGVRAARNLLPPDAEPITTRDAAEIARCDVSYIKAEILRGKLRARKIGKGRTSAYTIRPDDFRAWYRARFAPSANEAVSE